MKLETTKSLISSAQTKAGEEDWILLSVSYDGWMDDEQRLRRKS